MKTTTSVVLTGVIVAVGHWSKEEKLNPRTFVGLAVVALALAAVGESNSDFAETFGVLLVVAALFYYGIPIADALKSGGLSQRRGGGGRF